MAQSALNAIDSKSIVMTGPNLSTGSARAASNEEAAIPGPIASQVLGQAFGFSQTQINTRVNQAGRFGVSRTEDMPIRGQLPMLFEKPAQIIVRERRNHPQPAGYHRPGEPAQNIFSYEQIFNFARQEICDNLARAVYIVGSGIEDFFLSDRLEPWIGLARPIAHNIQTRINAWPDVLI